MTIRAQLIICEAATQHNDGTFSMLRAGIVTAAPDSIPATLKLVIAVQIRGEHEDVGNHNTAVRAYWERTETPVLDVSGDLNVKAEEETHLPWQISFHVPLTVPISNEGKIVIELKADGVALAVETLFVVAPDQKSDDESHGDEEAHDE